MQRRIDGRDDFGAALAGLADLRRFAGSAADFWRLYMQSLQRLTGAAAVVIARRRGDQVSSWGRVGVVPETAATDVGLREFWRRLQSLAESVANEEAAAVEWKPDGFRRTDRAAGARLEADRDAEAWVALLYLPASDEKEADDALRRLRMAAYLPAHFQLRRIAAHLQSGESGAASVLDLVAVLNGIGRSLEASMAFCNELAARYRCDRVSLGWERRGYVLTRAVSHTDKFVRKMEAVQELEAAMEECFDQEETVVWPTPPGEDQITRDHEKYAASQGTKHVCSVPLRLSGRPMGVVLCERQGEAFEEEEVRDLLIASDLAAPRLAELEKRDRWFGARWASSLREACAWVVGPRHTWAKVTAVFLAVVLGVLVFGKKTYRVDAPFTLRAESVNFVTAPFSAYIREVMAEPGTAFRAGEPLMRFDTRDLFMEEAAALADLDRFQREAEKAQAENALAEMRIARAQAEQARIRLERVRHRLEQATIVAPNEGYVVEGDFKQRVGAPVNQGDILFRVSDLATAYVEARVPERDIRFVDEGASAKIAFASQPKLKFPVRVTLIEPVALADERGNVFVVRCAIEGEPESWWRPGMSGLTKIDGEPKTFLWILTRRTVDFLRLLFWW